MRADMLPPLPLYTSDVGWRGQGHPAGDPPVWKAAVADWRGDAPADVKTIVGQSWVAQGDLTPVPPRKISAPLALAKVIVEHGPNGRPVLPRRAYVPPLSHSAPPLYTSDVGWLGER